jgi:hypothetical protein
MWFMTVETVFTHRRMLKQERPALFCVAAITGFIHCGCPEESVEVCPVRIMTVKAADLPLKQGHMGPTGEIHSFFFVAHHTCLVHRALSKEPGA